MAKTYKPILGSVNEIKPILSNATPAKTYTPTKITPKTYTFSENLPIKSAERISPQGELTNEALKLRALKPILAQQEDVRALNVLPRKVATSGLEIFESLVKAPSYGVAGIMTSEGDSKRYEEANKYVPSPSKLSAETLAKAQEIADATSKSKLYPDNVYKFMDSTNQEIANFKTPGNRFLAQTVGAGVKMIPTIATGGALGAGAGLGVMGAGVYSNSMDEAIKGGSDVKKATQNALGQTVIEVGTERLFGGIPGLGKGIISTVIGKKLAQRVGTSTASKLLTSIGKSVVNKKALGVIGEGFEEVLAEYLSPIVERATIDPNASDATLAQLAEVFVTGAALSTVLQGGSIVLSSGKTISKAEDVQTLTPQEQEELTETIKQRQQTNNTTTGSVPSFPNLDALLPSTTNKNRGAKFDAMSKPERLDYIANAPLNEIMYLPQVVEARKKSRLGEPTISIQTEEREALRSDIAQRLYNDVGSAVKFVDSDGKTKYNYVGEVSQNKRVDIVIGQPASGKSSVAVDPLSELYRSRIIDSDIVKEQLKEFDNGVGASRVHLESDEIAKNRILEMATKNGDNIVIPVVGKGKKSLIELANFFNERGYTVNLTLNELPPDKAARRAITRFLETGRFVDPEYIIKDVGNMPSLIYEEMKGREYDGLFETYTKKNNDVARGEPAIQVEYYKRGDPGLYRSEQSGSIQSGGGQVYDGGRILNDVNTELSPKNEGRGQTQTKPLGKELPRILPKAQMPLQAPTLPVQKSKAELGKEIPKEQMFSNNLKMGEKVIGLERGNQGTIAKVNEDGSYLVYFFNKEKNTKALIKMQRSEFEPIESTINNLPKPEFSRNNFNKEFTEKDSDKNTEYEQFMRDTADFEEIQTGAELYAPQITGKGVARSKDIQRNADAAFKDNPTGREWFKKTVEDPLYQSKGRYTEQTKKQLDTIFNDIVVKLGINKGSKESAGLQWFGDGKKQRRSGNERSTESTPYTIEDLKQDFNYKMKNGKMAWENIVQAESTFKTMYLDYVGKINEALVRIYPNVEANVAKLETKLNGTTDEAARKKVLQEIDDAIVGKRLIPRKDYMPHIRELNKGSFLVGLDNIINGATNIDPRLIGVSEFTKPSSKWTGFLQHRKDGDLYAEDAIGAMVEYIPQAEYKINIEPNISILRSVIKNLKESTIQTKNANSFIDELMQTTNDIAGKTNTYDRMAIGFLGEPNGRKALNFLSVISNRMRANAVVGNVNTVIAQVFNMPNVVGYAKSPTDLAKGFATAIQASRGNPEARAILAKSMFLNERYLDRSFRRFDKGVVSDMNKFFSWTMELGDKAVADGAFITFYNQSIKKGMSEEQAILKADEMTRKSIAGRGIAEMPLSQKAKITKLFTPFQVEVRNAFNVLKDLGSERDILGFLGVFITSFLMNEILKATTGRDIGINPIGVIKDSIKNGSNVGLGLAGNLISNVPGGSYIADVSANALGLDSYKMQQLFGEEDPSRFGTGNIALQTLLAPVGQAMKGQNIDLLKPALALLPSIGGKQIERGIRGLQDMAVLPKEKIKLTGTDPGISLKKQKTPGSYSPSGALRFPLEPNLKNYLTAPALGTWATKEGKEYIKLDNGPLGTTQTENLTKIADRIGGMSELFKFVSQNRGMTKKAEVQAALQKSGLSTKQQNALFHEYYGYK